MSPTGASQSDPKALDVFLWAREAVEPLAKLPRDKYLQILHVARLQGWAPQKPSQTTGDLRRDFVNYLPPSKLDAIDADYLFEVLSRVCSTIPDAALGNACAQLLTADEFRAGFEVRTG